MAVIPNSKTETTPQCMLVIEAFLQSATYWSSKRGMIALFEHELEGFRGSKSMPHCRGAGEDWSKRQLQAIAKLSPCNQSPRPMDKGSIHDGSRKKQNFFFLKSSARRCLWYRSIRTFCHSALVFRGDDCRLKGSSLIICGNSLILAITHFSRTEISRCHWVSFGESHLAEQWPMGVV